MRLSRSVKPVADRSAELTVGRAGHGDLGAPLRRFEHPVAARLIAAKAPGAVMSAPAASCDHSAEPTGDNRLPSAGRGGKIEYAMPTDLTVILEHRPGELARLGEVTGEAGVTIHGLAAFTGEGRGVVHVLLDDEAVTGCRAALERAGMGIADEREVFMVAVDDRPAALGELTRKLAEANVNVDLAYTTFTGGKIVIATDDVESARAVLP